MKPAIKQAVLHVAIALALAVLGGILITHTLSCLGLEDGSSRAVAAFRALTFIGTPLCVLAIRAFSPSGGRMKSWVYGVAWFWLFANMAAAFEPVNPGVDDRGVILGVLLFGWIGGVACVALVLVPYELIQRRRHGRQTRATE